MSQKIDADTFESRWNNHVNELDGLGWNLGETDRERLFELTDELKGLISQAAENKF